MRVRSKASSLLVGFSLFVTACPGTGASREALVDILVVEADLSLEEATCVSDALYATVGLSEDEINNFSVVDEISPGADNFDKWQIYQNAVDTAVRTCVR